MSPPEWILLQPRAGGTGAGGGAGGGGGATTTGAGGGGGGCWAHAARSATGSTTATIATLRNRLRRATVSETANIRSSKIALLVDRTKVKSNSYRIVKQ